MKEKKNIDRIFQEKFKDFEKEPSDKLWSSIASKLDEKEEKKPFLIPLWAKIAGVAAVLALIVAGVINTEDPFTNENQIVNEEPENSKDEESKADVNKPDFSKAPGSSAVVDNGNEPDLSNDNETGNQVQKRSEKGKQTGSPIKSANSKPSFYQNKPDRIAADEKINPHSLNPTNNNEAAFKSKKIEFTTNGLASSVQFDSLQFKNDILDKTSENALASIEKEQNLNEGLDEENIRSSFKKMQISTFAAPIFYANTGSGNELSNQFAHNNSSSEITFSYGMKIAYNLNSKLKLRTGISKMNMSYNIQNIRYSPTASTQGFDNLNVVENNVEIRTTSSSAVDSDNSPSDNYLLSGIFSPGEINQQFGFIEVPLELEYTVINNQFGLNIIGGASSLFLDHNRVDLVAGSSITELGKASNINNTSFSTNIGFGLDYKFSQSIGISVEPILKYQLNTFKNVENVRPLNFGIYSGLNFKF